MQSTQAVFAGEQERFFHDAKTWEIEKEVERARSERLAWRVAIGAGALAIISVIGIATLAPFKRVIPYVFAVDRSSGNVEFVSATDNRATVGYQELLDKHWGAKYVTSREAYNFRLLQKDYDTVLSLSSDDIGREYAKTFEGTNARDKKFGAGLELRVQVLSVTLHQDDINTKAVVRFERTVRRTDADRAEAPQYFVATLSYEYKPSMVGREKDLIQNPLGYKVTAYRLDSEIASAAPAPAPTVPN